MTTDLTLLIQKYPALNRDVLFAYALAKKKLVDQGLPLVTDDDKIGQGIAEHALRLGLLEGFTEDEIRVYRTMLEWRHFLFRSPAVIASLARVNLADAGQATCKLQIVGLLGCQVISPFSHSYAFTDASKLSSEKVASIKAGIIAMSLKIPA
jgi:hypothetical protein